MSLVRTGSIKNLSIALEAISRIVQAEDAHYRITKLLDYHLNKAEEERRTEENPLPTTEPPSIDTNDDIPF